MNNTRRLEVPENIAVGTDNQPAWVDIKKRVKNKYINLWNKAASIAGQVNGLNTEVLKNDKKAQKEALTLMSRFKLVSNDIYEVYAGLVVDWNWLDVDGDPLPIPYNNPDVFENELDSVQTKFIREQVQEAIRYRATEGNVTSSDP